MVSLPDALALLYPAASPLRDYALADDGTGPRIAAWDAGRLGPQPTADRLAAVTDAQVAAAAAARLGAAADAKVAAPQDATDVAVTALGLVLNGALNEIRQRVNEIDARTGGAGTPLPLTTPDDGRALVRQVVAALLAGKG